MKQYNIRWHKKKMSFGELNVMSLGQRGRGRYECIIPVQDGLNVGEYIDVSLTKTGKPKIIKSKSGKDWLARISCDGVYTRGTEGRVYVHKFDQKNIDVVAMGNGAEGDAGRIGWWGDYLLKINDGTLIRVKPHGGYKTPAYYLFFGDKDVITFENPDELAIWLDGTCYEIDINNIQNSFVDV